MNKTATKATIKLAQKQSKILIGECSAFGLEIMIYNLESNTRSSFEETALYATTLIDILKKELNNRKAQARNCTLDNLFDRMYAKTMMRVEGVFINLDKRYMSLNEFYGYDFDQWRVNFCLEQRLEKDIKTNARLDKRRQKLESRSSKQK